MAGWHGSASDAVRGQGQAAHHTFHSDCSVSFPNFLSRISRRLTHIFHRLSPFFSRLGSSRPNEIYYILMTGNGTTLTLEASVRANVHSRRYALFVTIVCVAVALNSVRCFLQSNFRSSNRHFRYSTLFHAECTARRSASAFGV